MKTDWKQVEWWDVASLKPYPNNAKTHPQEQIEGLARTIAQSGWDVPIVVDEKGVIIKGHGRRLAALQLHLTQVPVIVRKGLSEAQKKAIRISDNKWSESPWDDRLLALELQSLSEELAETEDDFDLGDIGFSEGELNTLVERMETDDAIAEEPELDDTPPDAPKDNQKYPLSIVLDWAEHQEWQVIKESLREKSDRKAFLKLMQGTA